MQNELFESTAIPKAYLKLALPVVMSMVVTLIYNMVDTYFIAMTGSTDLIAGVSVCAPVFTFMMAMGDLWGLGGSSVISRLLGEGRGEDGKRLSIFCFWGAAVLGAVAAAVMLLFRTPILTFLGADVGTLPYAIQYYSWLSLGAPLIVFSLVPSNLLRTEGAANASMTGSVLGAVINMILDPIFILGFGMGAKGAAIASVIGYICTDIFYVIYIARKVPGLSMNPRRLSITGREVGMILSIGLPSAVTNFMQSIGMTITNRSLLPYGNEPIAMMGIALKIVNIAALVLVGLAFGGQPLIGYTYGARNRERLSKVIRFGYLVTMGTGLFLSVLLGLLSKVFVGAFVKDQGLIVMGAEMLRLQLVGMVFMGAATVTICIFQSTGKSIPAFLMSICRQGFVYAIVMAVASSAFGYMGVISAQAVTDVITVVIAVILLRATLGKELRAEPTSEKEPATDQQAQATGK
ncbi:putative efflux protein, MATE family [Lachnospiraceae bacterium NK3A20]|nr:putative efflux protein, MATE family [Lachnospiraceae bacterium NK3A20]